MTPTGGYRTWRLHFVVLFLLLGVPVTWAQEFRSQTVANSPGSTVAVDFSIVSDATGASVTLRNSSGGGVRAPQLSFPGVRWPYSADDIRQSLPTTQTDEDLAIAAWHYVISHRFHYCSAGTQVNGQYIYNSDPILILNGFGFGCCDQSALTLAWIWQQFGYKARVAVFDFHTVPELFFNNAWHMMDTDHEAYYFLNDGVTIASVAELLADPNMIVRQAVNGLDPIGWPAVEMAQLYVQYAQTLRYPTSYLTNHGLSLYLRPHEELVLHSQNLAVDSLKYDYGTPFLFDSVSTSLLNWDVSFGQSYWRIWASSINSVDAIPDTSGMSYLQNLTTSAGNVVYKESSPFPVLALSIAAQVAPGGGSLNAYLSADGVHWSKPVSFQQVTNISSYQLSADLTAQARGQYTYFVKIELVGGMRLHKIHISPVIQAASYIFPQLAVGADNSLIYNDASPTNQVRTMSITTAVPTGSPQIRGLQAESLVAEHPVYSLARDYGAANLVDGDIDSLAYPSGKHIDYAIHLGGPHVITDIAIDFGYFGTDPRYVTNWTLLGSNGGQNWQVVASGGFPGTATLDVPVNTVATDLRLVADGLNSIGAYEVRIFGTVVPLLNRANLSVFSNITENPVYSLARGYVAANLIDGNKSTLAYPANDNVDYQVSLGSPTYLSSASFTWGYFGSNPIYMHDWAVLARNGANQQWTEIAWGGFPAATASGTELNTIATDIRVVAHSTINNIGIYELQLYGLPVSGVPVLTGLTAQSNVYENPTYSLARGYQASNLVDENDATLAYPAAKAIDYTVDPGTATYVDSINILWGYFGQNSVYINAWQVFGLPDNSTVWEPIAHGDFPNSSTTSVSVKRRYRKLRVAAQSWVNDIGIYEFRVSGY